MGSYIAGTIFEKTFSENLLYRKIREIKDVCDSKIIEQKSVASRTF